MPSELLYAHIPLQEIDLENDRFCLRYPFEEAIPEDFRTAIIAQGILQPVTLRAQASRWQIVDGFRRLYLARTLGLTSVPAMLLKADVADLTCFEIATAARRFHDPLNEIELGLLLKKLRHPDHSIPEISEQFKTMLGLELEPKRIQELMALTELSAACRCLIVAEELPHKIAQLFTVFTEHEQEQLALLFLAFRFGRNKIRELLVWMDEICRREDIRVADVLADPAIDTAGKNEAASLPQRAEAIRERIRRRRYPTLSAHEDRFHDLQRQLKLPPFITLSPPAFFEGDRFEIRFQFKTKQQLDTVLTKLTDARRNPAVDDLLTLL